MYLSAYVKDKQTKQYTIIASESYNTKETFKEALIGNGYAVIRISNNRDLAAAEHGYKSFAEMKKMLKFYTNNPELFKKEIEQIQAIEAIQL